MAITIHQDGAQVQLPTSEEVARRIGISYRTFMRLIERGLLRPEKTNPDKDYFAFCWTPEAMFRAQIVGSLWGFGFSQERIEEIMRHLDEHTDFSEKKFLLADRNVGDPVQVISRGELLEIPTFLRVGCVLLSLDLKD